MKKILKYSFYLCILLCFLSCKKIDQLLTFTISNQATVTIPGSSALNLPVNISTPGVTTNSSEAFANNNTNTNLVKNIYLKKIGLKIVNPSNQNFNFLSSIYIYISTNSSNEIQLAYLSTIPENVDSLTLIPTQAALDTYVKAANYTLRTQVVTNQILTQNVDVNVSTLFQVTANL